LVAGRRDGPRDLEHSGAHRRHRRRPDIVVSPVVGFDATCYRLGYGGGFYDRTLAAMARKPLVIGVGFAISSVATIHPLPHDIPMDLIITENGCTPRPHRSA
jgi:5-formyltetrahydrofolate cyclo-ligase